MDEKSLLNNTLVFLRGISIDGTNPNALRALADVLDYNEAKLKALTEQPEQVQ